MSKGVCRFVFEESGQETEASLHKECGYRRISVNTPLEAMEYLHNLIQDAGKIHHFWADVVSLFDTTLFSVNAAVGHKQLTDIYLLGLCQQNDGTFVTLDTRVTTASIVSPHPELLRILTS